jgi:hypothetical protein
MKRAQERCNADGDVVALARSLRLWWGIIREHWDAERRGPLPSLVGEMIARCERVIAEENGVH